MLSTVLDLWQYAAALMGERGIDQVVSVDTPTRPLEKTFDKLYDNVRVALIRSAPWGFAKERQKLSLAPTVSWQGNRQDWAKGVWPYVYAPPVGMLRFIGFVEDEPAYRLNHDYRMLRLPISYDVIGSAPGIGAVWNGSANLPLKLYRDGFEIHFTSVDGAHVLTPLELVGTLDFVLGDAKKNILVGSPSQLTFNGGVAWGADLVAYSFQESTPSPTLFVAYGDPSVGPWSDHIATVLDEATAVYLRDVTDVSIWPAEFQELVALRLARMASVSHAKNNRVLQSLAQQEGLARSAAVTTLLGDDQHTSFAPFSTTEIARL